ncbi:MAG TPA: carbon monoxide dehydrogenase, partial [Methyloceanibacter sp.]|nr:carbon monoxide dehydrogenase [Methyloceanibacter sp.]
MRGEQHQFIDPPHAGELALSQLARFTRTLRQNAFTLGLKESEDAARVLASDAGRRAVTLRAALKALLCARRSDWDKF